MDGFCPKCSALLIPANNGKNSLTCSCGYTSKGGKSLELKEDLKHEESASGVADKQEETLAKVKVECSKCGHPEALFWTLQTRATDEPETEFFRCCKCKYTWREYS